ncbi:OsmC family protein [Promethearchaeum syntrophicum]|uniref:OsmC family protein n=1 Tax=Promethearchaeum syntrophicum TaxID=2594042 RepID=A0A5B9D9D4_9ARCH|nr:OsmC family protein [Candidatus Prometheoarchaeum syntrophicum]QEE15467.1 OsmC-like protein [Candidatus Prometheoarchaeum syntrophicum]
MVSFKETYEAIKADITKGEKNFNVECTMLKEGMQTEVKMGAKPHIVIIDAPPGLDGTDMGPSPLLAILGSIGACIIAVTKFWSKIMNIQIDEMKVFSRGHLNLGALFGINDEMLPGYDKLEPIIRIKSPEPEERIKEMMEKVYTHCPVITNFNGATPLNYTLKYRKSE